MGERGPFSTSEAVTDGLRDLGTEVRRAAQNIAAAILTAVAFEHDRTPEQVAAVYARVLRAVREREETA